MRRFVTLAVLLLFTIPFGVSISGCSKAVSVTYCNGQDSGVKVGQLTELILSPQLTGISINEGAIGSVGIPSGYDCHHNSVSPTGLTYASSNINLVNVNPTSNSQGLCAGHWNLNSGGGIANYTVCTPDGEEGIAYVTASAQGVTSNAIAVYVHPVVTSIILGAGSTDCATDPASNCFAQNSYTCNTTGAPVPVAPSFTGACVSQRSAQQLAARSYAGTGSSQTNVSCLVGPLQFTAQTASVVSINTDGLATAAQPGSTIITAGANTQTASTAGFFSTCPPASISLAVAGQTAPPAGTVSLSQNIPQDFVATVTDINGVALTNITLEYESTTPTTIPATPGVVTPTYPGSAAITAICQPPACNSAPFNLIGVNGNGTPVTSEPVQVTAKGTGNSTVLYMASTESQYLQPHDFTVTTQATPTRLPYVPNSLVLSEDGTTIYMGTNQELMAYSTLTNALTRQDVTVSGTVLAVSPDNSTLVITDPVRQLTYLYATASGSVQSEYGGVGVSAQFSPDSTTVYIPTTDGRMLVHSTFIGWDAVSLTAPASGVAVTVPNAGVYLSQNPVDVRTNCPVTSITGTGLNQVATNVFYPDLGPVAGANGANTAATKYGYVTNNIASTDDGLHELTANPGGNGTPGAFTDILSSSSAAGQTPTVKSGACPVTIESTINATIPFTVANPTTIDAVLPTTDSDFAFVTYQGTGGVVPQYVPSTKTLTNIPLATYLGTPIAPVAGVVSSDDQTFYVGTTGDNLVHRLARGAAGFTDSLSPLTPALPNISGSGYATPNLLVQKPRKSTS